MTIDINKPVRVTDKGLKANPAFAGLLGSVVPTRGGQLVVYFPKRGASSVWLEDEIENVPDRRDESGPARTDRYGGERWWPRDLPVEATAEFKRGWYAKDKAELNVPEGP